MRPGDRYELIRVLKRGGMAEVFEGIMRADRGFEARIALKRLLPESASDESLVSGFVDEARIVSRLSHANIVRILDFGLIDGVPFQAQELIDGLDLEDLAARAKEIPVAIALHITTEIAHALAYVHGAMDASGKKMGIVHRDVSPANILVSWAGDVKLADFGIAFAIERLQVTQVGIAKGKRAYMAPEQLEGREVDGRTDVYALGCVLEYLLAKSGPLPEDVAKIVKRAKWPHKDGRYASAHLMAGDCGRALATRISTDARTMICEWLETQRAPAAVVPAANADQLFDLELILGSSPGGVRRFGSVAVEPATRMTEVAPDELPETRVTEPELDPTPILGPITTHDEGPIRELARARTNVRFEDSFPPPRPRRRDRTTIVALGLGVAGVFFVAVTVTVAQMLSGHEQHVLIMGDLPQSGGAAKAVPRVQAIAEQVEPAEDFEGDVDSPRPARKRHEVSAAELDAKLATELAKKNLVAEDLEAAANARARLEAYRRAKVKRDADAMTAAFDALGAEIRELRVDRAILDAKLARIERRLKDAAAVKTADEIAALDSAFIDLRVALARAASGEEHQLAARMTELERKLSKLR